MNQGGYERPTVIESGEARFVLDEWTKFFEGKNGRSLAFTSAVLRGPAAGRVFGFAMGKGFREEMAKDDTILVLRRLKNGDVLVKLVSLTNLGAENALSPRQSYIEVYERAKRQMLQGNYDEGLYQMMTDLFNGLPEGMREEMRGMTMAPDNLNQVHAV